MYDVAVRWRCFPLHPETPQEGQLLEDLFNSTPEKINVIVNQLKKTANDLGLPFGVRTRTYNSRLAQELGLWAEDTGKGDAFHMAAFRAYFDKGLNISNQSVLLDLAENVGLDRNSAESVLKERSYKAKVDQDWADSRMKGITAVPTFGMGDHKIVGAQSFEMLQQLVIINNVKER
jgi:predicted DsbA family dithiol-disulfide isomerase